MRAADDELIALWDIELSGDYYPTLYGGSPAGFRFVKSIPQLNPSKLPLGAP